MLTAPLVALLVTSADPPKFALPERWHGTWTGTLEILEPPTKDLSQKLPMSLEVAPLADGGTTWRITYGSGDSKQVRAYEMKPGDVENRFVIDEKNGILLDARLNGNLLVSAFEVQGNLLTSRYELSGDDLRFEIITFAASAPRVSNVGEGDKAITVKSFPQRGWQKATLHRAAQGSSLR